MKMTLTIAMVFLLGVPVFAQKTEKRFIHFETSISFTHDNSLKEWKPSVPYKNCVRIVSELFDVPSDGDSASQRRDITIQFFEYLMNNYLEDLTKMRLHTEGGLMIEEYDGTIPTHVQSYDSATGDRKDGSSLKSSCPPEIILIKGFKYSPNKYTDYEKYKGTTPLYEQARQILYGRK